MDASRWPVSPLLSRLSTARGSCRAGPRDTGVFHSLGVVTLGESEAFPKAGRWWIGARPFARGPWGRPAVCRRGIGAADVENEMARELPNPEHFKVETTVEVRWSDLDALRHVNNARYLTFCEMANFSWFAKVAPGQELHEVPAYPVLARAECDFVASILYPSTIQVLTRAVRVGSSSLCLEHFLRDAESGKAHALVHLTLVFIDRETHRATPIPEEIRRAIEALDGV